VKKPHEIDMLHGKLGPKITSFALPIALTGIMQQMFNAADVAVVGRFASKYAMAAVGSNSSLINLFITLFVGISLGANVVIARYTGQGDEKGIQKAVHTAITFSLIGGVGMAILCELLAGPILQLMGVPDNIFDMALLYIRIIFAGLPVTFLYNFESAIFRSQGDTRTPLICLIVSGVINVVLNLLFVLGFGMDVDGVAIATVISTTISSLLMLRALLRTNLKIRLSLKELGLDKAVLGSILRIGVPSGLQGMLYSLSNVIIQTAINSLGADVMAGSSAAFNIEIFAFYLVESFGQACTTFTSQNYGAGNPKRCKSVFWNCILQETIVALVSTAIILLLDGPLLSLFNTDPDVIVAGTIRLRYVVGFEFLNGACYVVSAYMRGFGSSLTPAIVSVAGICGLRIFWVYTVFAATPTFARLMMVYPVSWVITVAALVVAYFILRKKQLEGFFNSVNQSENLI